MFILVGELLKELRKCEKVKLQTNIYFRVENNGIIVSLVLK